MHSHRATKTQVNTTEADDGRVGTGKVRAAGPRIVDANEEFSDFEDADDEDDIEDEDELSTDFAEVGPVDNDEANGKLFREDPILDRRIIEGMLQDRNVFLEEMQREGFGQAAVLRRAAELGLSEALIRQVKGVAADLAGERPGRRPAPSSLGARTCLSCDRVFLSSGPGNRLCMRCRGGDAGLAQL